MQCMQRLVANAYAVPWRFVGMPWYACMCSHWLLVPPAPLPLAWPLCLLQEVYSVVLFYKYVRIVEPPAFVAFLKDTCTGLGLTGRVLVAEEVR
jgi:hypothetical protein